MQAFNDFGTGYVPDPQRLDVKYVNACCDPLIGGTEKDIILDVFGNKKHIDPAADPIGAEREWQSAKRAWYMLRTNPCFEEWLQKALEVEVERSQPKVRLQCIKSALRADGRDAARLLSVATRVEAKPDQDVTFEFNLPANVAVRKLEGETEDVRLGIAGKAAAKAYPPPMPSRGSPPKMSERPTGAPFKKATVTDATGQ